MKTPSTGALRSRLFRQRKRNGVTVAQIEINPKALEALVQCGFLNETVKRQNNDAIAESVEFLLSLLADGALLLDDFGLD